MAEAGIRALKQNASAVVRRAAAGETFTITDRGRAVAELGPLRHSRLEQLGQDGRLRPPRRPLSDLAAAEPGPDLTGDLTDARASERY